MGRVADFVLSLHGLAAYLVVGAAAGLEASAFLGLAVPGELAVLLGGVLVFQGKARFLPMAIAASSGAILGDSVGYAVGKLLGPRMMGGRLGRIVGPNRWRRAQALIAARGATAVIVGRFTAACRVLVPGLAGMAGMPYRRFVAANVAGGILWATGFTALGYAAGGAWRHVERWVGRASLILLALLVVMALLVGAVRYAARHPDQLRSAWDRVAATRPVAWLQRRFSRQLAFAGRRLDPWAATGLRLTVWLMILGCAGWAFGALTEDVLAGQEAARLDLPLALAISRHTTPGLVAVMRAVSHAADPAAVLAIGIFVSVWWWRRRRDWQATWLLGVSVVGSIALAEGVELLVRRPRPPVHHFVRAVGWSFPSGHATTAAALYGALAVLACRLWRDWRARVYAWGIAAGIMVAVAASRLVLGVHYLTDVAAGLALGGMWVAAAVVTDPTFGISGSARATATPRRPAGAP